MAEEQLIDVTSRYWDWSLDWRDLTHSSIWDVETGFGGDGWPLVPSEAGHGYCVNGSFSDLRPVFFKNHTNFPHCLSREPNNDTALAKHFSPDSIGRFLQSETYAEFEHEVELYLHNPMHVIIGGDFEWFTAPNGRTQGRRVECMTTDEISDPVFFLHHAQLDRLWWDWQRRRSRENLRQYNGRHMRNSTGNASLDDLLVYGAVSQPVPVAAVLDTTSALLCYTY